MIAWVTVVEFVKNNKGLSIFLAVLILLTLLAYFLGNTVVECVAYFQPKVTIIQQTINKQVVHDRTVTTRYEIVKTDGSVEKHETIQAAVDSTSEKIDSINSVKEPVGLSGLNRRLALITGIDTDPFNPVEAIGARAGLAYGEYQLDYSLNMQSQHRLAFQMAWTLGGK